MPAEIQTAKCGRQEREEVQARGYVRDSTSSNRNDLVTRPTRVISLLCSESYLGSLKRGKGNFMFNYQRRLNFYVAEDRFRAVERTMRIKAQSRAVSCSVYYGTVLTVRNRTSSSLHHHQCLRERSLEVIEPIERGS